MKKIVFTLTLLLSSYWVTAQVTAKLSGDTTKMTSSTKSTIFVIENATKDTLGYLHNMGHGRSEWRVPIINDIRGLTAALEAAGGTIPGNSITSLPSLGDTPGAGQSAANWIIAEYYKSQPPTAALSGGFSYERMASGAQLTITLAYTAGRQAATATLAAFSASPPGIQIVGPTSTNTPSFSQPSAPGTVSGTVSPTLNRNTNGTFTLTVYTTDGKFAQASTAVSFYDKGYAGYATNTLVSGKPIASDILGFPITDNAGGVNINTQATSIQGSDKYYCFITTGTRSHVSINGTPSDAAFNFNIAITFTNASGGTFTGYAHVSKFPGGSTGAVTYVFN